MAIFDCEWHSLTENVSITRNLPVKLSKNLSTDLAEVVKSLFLFIAMAAILFNVAESFEQFW